MKVYFLNLDRSQDRNRFMSDQLSELGLDAIRIPAVEGSTLSEEEYLKRNPTRNIVKVEVACFLSHRKGWKQFIESNEPFAAFMEDDVHISPNITHLLKNPKWIPNNADVIKFEIVKPKKLVVSREAISIFNNISIRRLHSEHLGAAGYILTQSAAIKLYNWSEHFNAPVDHFLFDNKVGFFQQLNIYQTFPALAIQDLFINQANIEKSLLNSPRMEFRQTNKNHLNLKTYPKLIRELLRIRTQIESGTSYLYHFATKQRIKIRPFFDGEM